MASWPCAFYFAGLMQYMAYILIFCVLAYFTFEITNNFLWGVMFTMEAILCLGVHIWAMSEIKPVERFAKEQQAVGIEENQ